MIEKINLDEVPEGYARMMSGDARFRVVVSMD
jgi:D-arabinose 1-dehydrogenase-like Zn-dependent alcohol dehydrogenase